jgi:hypothetical protein
LEERTLLSFAAPVAFNLGAAPNAIAVGHFEGAGAPLDVVTANANGTVSVLLGKGDGTLQNPINITVGGSPDAVAVGDLNGDGLQDIVVAKTNGKVTLLLSNGNGTFKAPKSFSIGGGTPTGVVLGDFNGDGKLDIVTANTNGAVSVLLGNGTGAFRLVLLPAATGSSLTSVAVGDINGDGKPDLVVGTNTGLDILLGQGGGAFQFKQQVTFEHKVDGLVFKFAVNSVAVADLRGDGKEDVVALASDGATSVLLGNGDGTVRNPVAAGTGGYAAASFVVGDFNGDGKPDIATSGFPQQVGGGPSVSVATGKGDGTFNAAQNANVGETATALAAGDFRGDGKLDLVLASNLGSNSLTVLPGNGDGTFAAAPAATANVLPFEIEAADFNGDGKPDLAVLGEIGVAVLLGNGNGTFRPGPQLTVEGSAPGAFAIGDFNGDGKQDIAVDTGSGIDVFFGNGNGTFQAPKEIVNFAISDNIVSMVAGVFVPGGGLDLAVLALTQQSPNNSEVTLLLNNGNGTFIKGQTIHVGDDASSLATADFNGDAKLDLVTTSFLPGGNHNVEVLLNKGNGTFNAPVITTPGGRSTTVATGDFNGDGKPDVLLTDYFDNTVSVLPGNGNGSFGTPLVFHFNNPVQEVGAPAVGDFFGDGKLSVAVPTGLGEVSVLRGNGDATFQADIDYLGDFHGQEPAAVVAADFNGDGKLDLAATSFLAGDVSVLLNTSPPASQGTIATTTRLTSNAHTAVFGQQVTLTATVTAAKGVPTGTVSFFDGGTPLGEVALDPNGQARLLVQLATGTHSLHASFAGIAPFTASASASLSETVNKDATTTKLSVDTDAFGISGFVLLTATIAPVAPGAGSPTGTVTFFEGDKIIGTGTVSGGQATLFLERKLGPGKHTVTAVYSGDDDFEASTSPAVTFTTT